MAGGPKQQGIPAVVGSPGTDLTAAQATEACWKIISRYDFYYGSVNTKAAVLIAFNTFVAGSLVLKWQDIQKLFEGSHKAFFLLACVALLFSVAASLMSLWHTFQSVNPFLHSPSDLKKYHSLIFFNDVVKFNKEDYFAELQKLKDVDLNRDIVFQCMCWPAAWDQSSTISERRSGIFCIFSYLLLARSC